MMLLVFCVFSAVVFSSHYYVWQRLVRAAAWPQPLPLAASSLLVAGAVGIPASFLAQRLLALRVARPALAMLFAWLGTFFFLFVTTLAADVLIRGITWWMTRQEPSFSLARRLWLVRAGAVGSVTAATAMAIASRRSVAHGPQIHSVVVTLEHLHPSLNGLRIAQISDLHVAPLLGRDYVEHVVDKTLAQHADVIVLTGDLMDGSVDALGEDMAPLGRLHARLGVYMVTGNHEYYSGVDQWLPYLRSLGIRVLRNERVSLGTASAPLELAGIDDWTARAFGGDHGADLPRALLGRDPSTPVVLLAHQPRAVDEAARYHVDLMLSGHTHGGQLWPFGALVRLVQPYLRGLHRHSERTQIYVHPGTGYWGPPMRLGSPSEIALLTLRSSQA